MFEFGLLLILLLVAGFLLQFKRNLLAFDKDAVLPLRGILVLLVIIGHELAALGLGRVSLATPAVAVFFFISGYGLMHKRLTTEGRGIHGGFRKAFAKLVPTFVVASVLFAVVQLLRGKSVPLMQNILHGSSNLPIPFTWYVPSILTLYGIFYLSDKTCRQNRMLILSVLAGVIGYWVLTALIFQWPFYWWKTVFSFVSGVLFAANEDRIRRMLKVRPLATCLVATVVLLGAYSLHRLDYFPVRFAADHLYFAVIGPIVALSLFVLRCPRFFAPIGIVSYELYIVHGAFVWEFTRIIDNRVLYVLAVIVISLITAVGLRALMRMKGLNVEG